MGCKRGPCCAGQVCEQRGVTVRNQRLWRLNCLTCAQIIPLQYAAPPYELPAQLEGGEQLQLRC